MKWSFLSLPCLLLAAAGVDAQSLKDNIEAMKTSYAASGSIVTLNDRTLVIEPNMPGPVCALPRNEAGKTSWSYFAFPLSSITVPLASIDDSLIGEDLVFTNPDVAKVYKPGDVGDTTMIVITGAPGTQFHTLMYDREKLTHLGPGVHNSAEYDQAPDDVEAFGLTFTDRAAAQSFLVALKSAVRIAKTQPVAKVNSEGH
jgi:hypothetical protein